MPVVLSTEPRDALTADLGLVGPKAGATAGDPIEWSWSCSTMVGRRWASGMHPGSWASEKVGFGELMHFVAGHGWITDADGTRHEIAPGFVRYFPDGWRGTWEVDATVRKVYVLVSSDRD